MFSIMFLLFLFGTSSAIQARCTMKVHNEGTEIGDVLITEDGNYQTIKVLVEGEMITRGRHGFQVRTGAVQGNDCSADSVGGHYNPLRTGHGGFGSPPGLRHAGDLGNVRAGERGEIDYSSEITIYPWKPVLGSGLTEPTKFCDPYFEKIWPGGRRVKIDADKAEHLLKLQEERQNKKASQKRRKRSSLWNKWQQKKSTKKKDKKKNKIAKKNQSKRKNSNNVSPKKKRTYEIRQNDCYEPKWLQETWNFHEPRFTLLGEESIVGRAVVIYSGRDDLGSGGSKDTGNEGPPIACCTLEIAGSSRF